MAVEMLLLVVVNIGCCKTVNIFYNKASKIENIFSGQAFLIVCLRLYIFQTIYL